ncbi:MAG: DUF3052 domain-containing protein [Micrococcales bacterium]|nr:DUF3052 domain-containing protein [Micrococcales bacterium]
MSSSTEGSARAAQRLGFSKGHVVQELGYDEDVDAGLRADLEEILDGELVDEDYDDVTDGALIWHRSDDGDLGDALVDALAALDDNGPVWVLTPKAGRDGHVPPSDVEDAATTTGMHVISTFSVAPDWSATRVASRGRGR